MSNYQLRRDVYDYLYCRNRGTLGGITDAVDADIHDVLEVCKRLRDEGHLTSANSERMWSLDSHVAGFCPECGSGADYSEGPTQSCTECDWSETWTCARCGDEEHDAIEFPLEQDWSEVEVDVTCQSVYITPTDGGDGFAFSHSEFEGLISHFNQSEYTK